VSDGKHTTEKNTTINILDEDDIPPTLKNFVGSVYENDANVTIVGMMYQMMEIAI
jgi:hypothetical protein